MIHISAASCGRRGFLCKIVPGPCGFLGDPGVDPWELPGQSWVIPLAPKGAQGGKEVKIIDFSGGAADHLDFP